MRCLKLEMFVDDSTLSQLFEPSDFEDTHLPSIYPVASHSYCNVNVCTVYIHTQMAKNRKLSRRNIVDFVENYKKLLLHVARHNP